MKVPVINNRFFFIYDYLFVIVKILAWVLMSAFWRIPICVDPLPTWLQKFSLNMASLSRRIYGVCKWPVTRNVHYVDSNNVNRSLNIKGTLYCMSYKYIKRKAELCLIYFFQRDLSVLPSHGMPPLSYEL